MEQRKENKMGTMPVGKLLTGMSLPIMASMLVQALYNIVDSIFVAQIGENALTAVSLVFPVQALMIAVGVGTGVGINSILSRRLGEQKFEEANHVASNGIVLLWISGIAFALIGLLFSRTFFMAFTDDAEIVQMGYEYMMIVCLFSIGSFTQIGMERLMQATGNANYSMIIQGVGAIINIVLDPIFIFGLCGMPKMGVAGAAVATVLGQLIGAVVGLILNFKKNKEIHFTFKNFRPNFRVIKDIYAVGFPSIIMQSIGSVMVVGMNKILIMFSATAVSVFGVYFKLQSFVFMPVFGLNSGLIPIVGYNFGARSKKRMQKAILLSMYAAVAIMALGTVLFQLIPTELLYLFNASEDMLGIGVPALRIISLSFILAGVNIVLSSAFQAVGKGVYSMIGSICRQLVIILPVAYVLALTMGVHAVWWAFPISEVIVLVQSVWFYARVHKKLIAPLGNGESN